LRDLLSPITDPAVLDDVSTPQGQAFAFLVNDDFDPCTYATIEQRYGLSVLYYSTGGESWNENEGWVQVGVNECEWFNITCSETDLDFVVAVTLGKFDCLRYLLCLLVPLVAYIMIPFYRVKRS
jgi:hypothetical protein